MNVSPFGEWRWSPMGLAGRDPIFYAQLESEIAFVKEFFKNDPAKIEEKIRAINNTCFKCHGVMGKRRLDDDHGGPDKGNFDPAFVYATYDNSPPQSKAFIYGALARDGVSCMACHRIVEDKLAKNETDPLTSFLKNNITGNFTVGGADQIFGPFKDDEIVTDPMNNALGIKPKHDPYIKKSRMCGNCHTINLPLMDNPTLNPDKPHLEQLTYLEWLNSGYQNEYGNNPRARTCQDCHMETKYSNSQGTLKVPLIQQPIAFIEDDQYPQTGNRLPAEKIKVRFRDKGFARHQLQGLNVSLLEMFRQYMSPYNSNGSQLANAILGVRQNDYMSGLDDLATAIDAFVEQAQSATADVALSPVTVSNQKLIANVMVTNKTGHRLPSGVGFRRAFLELRVIDNSNGQTVWCSGCTNELGVITNGGGSSKRKAAVGAVRCLQGRQQAREPRLSDSVQCQLSAWYQSAVLPAALLLGPGEGNRRRDHAAGSGADLRGVESEQSMRANHQLYPARLSTERQSAVAIRLDQHRTAASRTRLPLSRRSFCMKLFR